MSARFSIPLSARRFSLRKGQLFGLYVMGYPLGRIVFELMRSDYANHILGVRVNVWTSILVFLLGVGLVWFGRRREVAVPRDATSHAYGIARLTCEDGRGSRYPRLQPWPRPSTRVTRVCPTRVISDAPRPPKDGDPNVTPARFSAQPADTGPVPPRARARRLRRGPRGDDARQRRSRHRRPRAHRAAQPRPPRRHRRRPAVGDGAGILTQVPDALPARGRRTSTSRVAGAYAVGWPSCPTDAAERAEAEARIEDIAAEEGLRVLGWRDVPGEQPTWSGQPARDCMPFFRQLFVSARPSGAHGRHRARPAGVLPAQAGRARDSSVYFPSLSRRTLVYKGMLTTGQLEPFFPDLSDRALRDRSSPWSTRASRPTPSRPGRSRTRTG